MKRLHYQALRSKKDLDCFFKEAALMRRIQHRCMAPITRNLPSNLTKTVSKAKSMTANLN